MERIDSLPPEIELALLLQRVGAHDTDAFRTLYDRTAPTLFARLLRLLRQHHAAEEVLQETYARAWQRAAQYEAGRGRPLAWLVTLARYSAFDYLERTGANRAEDEMPSGAGEPLPNHRETEMAPLSEEEIACLELAWVEGRSRAEIATLRSRPVKLVRRRIRDALLALRGMPHAEKAA